MRSGKTSQIPSGKDCVPSSFVSCRLQARFCESVQNDHPAESNVVLSCTPFLPVNVQLDVEGGVRHIAVSLVNMLWNETLMACQAGNNPVV